MTTFSHAGVSTLNGVIKVRFANDAMRVKVLAKGGHKDIDIIELKTPMTKEDAVDYLISIDFDNGNAAVRAALEAEQVKRTGRAAPAPKAEKQPKVKAAKVKPTIESIKSKAKAKTEAKTEEPAQVKTAMEQMAAALSNIEDAPF